MLPPGGGTSQVGQGFARFWELYPHKVGEDTAARAWVKQGCEAIADEVLAGLERTMDYLTRENRQYVPNPGSWLNAGRWKDEPRRPAPTTRKTAANVDVARRFIERGQRSHATSHEPPGLPDPGVHLGTSARAPRRSDR
jgi:hypothetical protein